jgi:uncharacterized MAPEG superfamily protein
LICLILAVLALFVLQTLLPASFRYLLAGPGTAQRLQIALGSRDTQPPMPPAGARAERALGNLHEALPVFLTLALLHVFQGNEHALAIQGAWAFLAARVLYVPAYLSGIFGLRSAIWIASWVGLGMMLVPLLSRDSV